MWTLFNINKKHFKTNNKIIFNLNTQFFFQCQDSTRTNLNIFLKIQSIYLFFKLIMNLNLRNTKKCIIKTHIIHQNTINSLHIQYNLH